MTTTRTVADTIIDFRESLAARGVRAALIADGDTPDEADRFLGTLLADRLLGHTVPELRTHLGVTAGTKADLIDHIVAVTEPVVR